MRILALDLATKTGWAIWDGTRIESGVANFAKGRGESNGILFLKFNRWLAEKLCPIAAGEDGGLVVFEQAHHRGGAATEIAVGLMTRVLEACARHEIEHAPVHSATLKKWATGHGRAGKDEMIGAAYRLFPKAEITDDNEADALCLLAHALAKYGSYMQNIVPNSAIPKETPCIVPTAKDGRE